jgi:hypothetical protein
MFRFKNIRVLHSHSQPKKYKWLQVEYVLLQVPFEVSIILLVYLFASHEIAQVPTTSLDITRFRATPQGRKVTVSMCSILFNSPFNGYVLGDEPQ